jgi:putative peptidoglycan lipid II flippase
VVAAFGLASRLLGYVRDNVLLAEFDASGATDAFYSSLLIVNSVAAVLLYTLVTVVIPAFQKERADRGERSAWALAWAVSAWVGALLVVLSVLLAVFPQIGGALFGVNAALEANVETLLRIMAPAVMLQGLSALFTALLQIHGRFAGPAAVGVVFNIGIIAAAVLAGDQIGIEAAAWGVSIGAVLQVVFQLPQFFRLVRGVSVRPRLTHPGLGDVALLAAPVVVASLLQQVNNFTDKVFAGTLEPGRIAALTTANTLGQVPRAVLLLPLLTPLFPLLAGLVAEGRHGQAAAAYYRAAGILAMVSMPVSVFMAVNAEALAAVLFQRGECGTACVTEIGEPLVFYGLAVWPGFLGFLNNRALSAGRFTRDITVSTVIVVSLTIALDALLIGPMEQSGLALATAIALYVNVGVTALMLRRRTPELPLRATVLQQLRVLTAVAAGGAVALALAWVAPADSGDRLHQIALMTVEGLAAGAVFVAAARVVAPDELREAWDGLRAVAGRGRRPRPAR